MSIQDNRLMTIETPLGPDFFTVESFHGTEEISKLFRFDLELRGKTLDVAFSRMIDQPVTLTLELPDGSVRFFNGIVADFSQGLGTIGTAFDAGTGLLGDGSFPYKCTLVPRAWSMKQTADLRIFTEKTIPEILEEFFAKFPAIECQFEIKKTHPTLPLCTQFQESDFTFVSRLMERAGIFYFFKHEEKQHTMVITDTNATVKFFQDDQDAKFKTTDTSWLTDENIIDLYWREKIRSREITLKDYNSDLPSAALLSSTETTSDLGDTSREFFEYPGEYTSHEDGEGLSKLRMEEQEAKLTKIKGKSTYRTMQAGSKFKLKDYFRDDRNNKSYLLTSVTHSVAKDDQSKGIDAALHYWNDFSCMPTDKPFRPPRKTKKPKVNGVQLAKVASDPDEYGRVDIMIVWDREENIIPQVPVSQIMAGANWGTMFVPHIDHEVVVDFIGGDPDRPIIVGRLYNGDNKPKYELPAEKTKSVIYSEEGNGIVIEDASGDRHIHIYQDCCDNEIILHEKEPRIEIEQECGNRICLDGADPSIEIVQACGNKIYMDGATESISMFSPTGNSKMILGLDEDSGKIGIHQSTDQTWWQKNASASSKISVGASEELALSAKATQTVGLETQTFVGGKHETHIGAKYTCSHASEFGDNYAAKKQKVKKVYSVDSKKSIELSAGPSGDAQGVFDKDGVWFETGGSVIDMDKGSTINISSKKDIILEGTSGIKIKDKKEIKLDAKKITATGTTFTFNGSKINIG